MVDLRAVAAALMAAILVTSCAAPSPRAGTFRVVHFVPELKGAAVYGYMTFDSLPPGLREGASRLGYKPGDQVPTKRYSDEHPDRSVYFLRPPIKDLRTRNPGDWVKQ